MASVSSGEGPRPMTRRRCAYLPIVIWLLGLGSAGCQRSASHPDQQDAVEITTGSGVKMMLIPGGRFTMGSTQGPADESPRHEVTITAFAMDKFEVTQAEFAKREYADPSHFKHPQRPVEQIRWSDAALFCNERSRHEGRQPCYDETTFACNFEAGGYRLPTEAEWEYAARAGSTSEYGASPSAEKLKSYACYAPTSTKKTDRVGRKKPNAWGLHDMLGNVREWCHDVHDANYYANSPSENPRGPAQGKKRVMRGGAWNSTSRGCRVTTRYAEIPGITDACFARNTFGFRCVRRLTGKEMKLLHPNRAEDRAAKSSD